VTQDRPELGGPLAAVEPHGMQSPAASEPGGDHYSLCGLTEAQARRVLVAHTARFAADFLRWTDGRTGDGLSYQRLRLLEALHCRGPAIMRDLGDQLGVSPRHVTAIVDGLEQARLVVRRHHPADRRATLVELSADGVAAAERALEPRLEAVADVFRALTAAEREQFSTILTRLTKALARARTGESGGPARA
jgi:DNA-binding MarR family transcriptional regulator